MKRHCFQIQYSSLVSLRMSRFLPRIENCHCDNLVEFRTFSTWEGSISVSLLAIAEPVVRYVQWNTAGSAAAVFSICKVGFADEGGKRNAKAVFCLPPLFRTMPLKIRPLERPPPPRGRRRGGTEEKEREGKFNKQGAKKHAPPEQMQSCSSFPFFFWRSRRAPGVGGPFQKMGFFFLGCDYLAQTKLFYS